MVNWIIGNHRIVDIFAMDVIKSSENDEFTPRRKMLSDLEVKQLLLQDNRKVSRYKADMLEKDAKKNWDLFYKRNETRFFKDRHWTIREFEELLDNSNDKPRTLFEIGCGVGNFIFPLVEAKLKLNILACDLSPRATEMVKSNSKFKTETMKVFPCDITTEQVFNEIQLASVDIVTLIFVLSAIHPEKFLTTLSTIYKLLKPGGMLLFRDYGLYDMAQLRFKAGHKIDENFYMRQDGTRTYYFSTEHVSDLLTEAGFDIVINTYVHRRTINKKENIDVPRIFVQSKATKPN